MYNHLCEEHARKLLMELMTNNYRAKSIIGCYYFRFMLVAVTREARNIMHESFTDILILFCSRMGGGTSYSLSHKARQVYFKSVVKTIFILNL